MSWLGYIALFLTSYNIFCGLLSRLAGNNEAAYSNGLEASIWFVAAVIYFK